MNNLKNTIDQLDNALLEELLDAAQVALNDTDTARRVADELGISKARVMGLACIAEQLYMDPDILPDVTTLAQLDAYEDNHQEDETAQRDAGEYSEQYQQQYNEWFWIPIIGGVSGMVIGSMVGTELGGFRSFGSGAVVGGLIGSVGAFIFSALMARAFRVDKNT